MEWAEISHHQTSFIEIIKKLKFSHVFPTFWSSNAIIFTKKLYDYKLVCILYVNQLHFLCKPAVLMKNYHKSSIFIIFLCVLDDINAYFLHEFIIITLVTEFFIVFIIIFLSLVIICLSHLSLFSKFNDQFLIFNVPKTCCHVLLGISKFVFF